MYIDTYFMMHVVLFLTSLFEIVNALQVNRKRDFIVTKKTSNYSYPLALANNRTNVPSTAFCGALCLLDNGISYSYSHETKICLTYTKMICTTDGGVLSPGLLMYNIEAEEPTSCDTVQCSGVYTFDIPPCPPITLTCNVDASGSSWTVIQRRVNGSVDFARPWNDYKNGFGDAAGEFWLGNDNIYCLTLNGDQELRVEIETTGGSLYYAQYSSFAVGDAASKYKLSVSGYSGTAGDSLGYHNGAAFSTIDRDNDNNPTMHCARDIGAWWHKRASKFCCVSVLNGVYGSYIWWFGISYNSHKTTKMMIRRRT